MHKGQKGTTRNFKLNLMCFEFPEVLADRLPLPLTKLRFIVTITVDIGKLELASSYLANRALFTEVWTCLHIVGEVAVPSTLSPDLLAQDCSEREAIVAISAKICFGTGRRYRHAP